MMALRSSAGKVDQPRCSCQWCGGLLTKRAELLSASSFGMTFLLRDPLFV